MQHIFATCTWALYVNCVLPKCKLQSRCCILLQFVPVPLTFSNLRWLCFSFHQLAQTLYLHSGWLLSATCTGGLVHRSTGAYAACTDCNLHCVVVVVVVVVYTQHKHSTCTWGGYPWQLALVVLFPSSTCTYTACTDCNLHCYGDAWWW